MSEQTDGVGNRYSANYEKLIRVTKGIYSITIFPQTKVISGETIDNNAFVECKNSISEVIFASGSQLQQIQPYAFYECSNLSSIDFSGCSLLNSIGSYAFYKCSILSSVKFNEGLTTISSYSFRYTAITSILFPSTLKTLSDYSFSDIPNLMDVRYAPNCTIDTINSVIFESTKFDTLHIPPNLTTFSAYALWNNQYVKKIVFDDGYCVGYILKNDCLYTTDGKTLVFYPRSLNPGSTFTIPNDTVALSSFSMASSQIISVVIPESLISIGNNCFRRSTIRNITFPPNITNFGLWTFHQCSSLSNITFSGTITSLPYRFVSSSGLTSFYVPDGVLTIGELCFSGCAYLVSISLPESIQTINSGAFSDCNKNLKIDFRGNGSYAMDKTYTFLVDLNFTSIAGYFGSQENHEFKLFDSVQTIGQRVFANKNNIKGINISLNSCLTTIEDGAFESCTSLTYFNIKVDTLQSIGNNAFKGCSKLTSFSCGSNIQYIKQGAFSGCESLQSIKIRIPNSGETNQEILRAQLEDVEALPQCVISQKCFENCKSLYDVILGEGVAAIYDNCFQKCEQLKRIDFPQSLSILGSNIFIESGLEIAHFPADSNCISLSNTSFYKATHLYQVDFPDELEEIGYRTFSGTSLKNITLTTSIEILGEEAFSDNSNLTTFTIPSNSKLYLWKFGVLKNCSNFAEINCGDNNQFVVENYALFNSNRTQLYVLPPASSIRFFYLPSTVEKIVQYSFYGCKNLRTIMIPDASVTTIEAYSFQNCEKLSSINIPMSVTSIGNDAFAGCNHLVCGVVVDNTSLIDNLHSTAKLDLRALKSCSPEMSCKSNNLDSFHYHLLFSIFLIPHH